MRIRSLGLATAAALLGPFALAGSALAHAHLKVAVPAVNATVGQAPAELDLSFSEGVDLAFTGVALSGAQGAVPTGRASLRDGGLTLVVPLTGTLPAGTYAVAWHALAKDGHKTQGRYTFTVKP